jgi:hypothetical protein
MTVRNRRVVTTGSRLLLAIPMPEHRNFSFLLLDNWSTFGADFTHV